MIAPRRRPGAGERSVRLVLVLELAIGARVEEGLVPVIEAHEVRWRALLAPHLEDLSVPVGLADLLPMDDEAFADVRLHRVLLPLVPAYAGGWQGGS